MDDRAREIGYQMEIDFSLFDELEDEEGWARVPKRTTYHWWQKIGENTWRTRCNTAFTHDVPLIHNMTKKYGVRIKCGECQARLETEQMDRGDRAVDFPILFPHRNDYTYQIGFDPKKKMYFATAYGIYGHIESQTHLYHSWREAVEVLREDVMRYMNDRDVELALRALREHNRRHRGK